MSVAVEAVGWIGGGLILAAYLLVSLGKLSGGSAMFQWMNLFGAFGLAANSYWHHALPATWLDVAWFAIASVALVQIARGRATA